MKSNSLKQRAKRYIKTGARNAVRLGTAFAKQRYGGGIPGMLQLAKDVTMLKEVINSEKKRFNGTVSSQDVGQVNVNNSGHLCVDITPAISSGSAYNERTGSSVKLHSMFMRMQAYQQAQAQSPIKLKAYIVRVKGTPQNTTFFAQQFLQSNPFVSGTGNDTYDYNSSRNPDFFKQYQVIRTWTHYVQPDQIANQTMISDRKIGIKPKKLHIRYDKNTTNTAENQLMLLVVADSGNSGTTSSSALTGVPVVAPTTGAIVNWTSDFYYYDN